MLLALKRMKKNSCIEFVIIVKNRQIVQSQLNCMGYMKGV